LPKRGKEKRRLAEKRTQREAEPLWHNSLWHGACINHGRTLGQLS